MASNYIQPGEVIDHTPTSAVASGEAVVIGGRVGVALDDIAANETGSVAMTGVFELPKKDAEAASKGVTVYWNGSALTTTASGNTEAGYAFRAAAAEDTTCHVKLRG